MPQGIVWMMPVLLTCEQVGSVMPQGIVWMMPVLLTSEQVGSVMPQGNVWMMPVLLTLDMFYCKICEKVGSVAPIRNLMGVRANKWIYPIILTEYWNIL